MSFKFQSDSINPMLLQVLRLLCLNFKFQSDSINPSNSEMQQLSFYALNSNLILLIRSGIYRKGSHTCDFKFQSDSINPKRY